MRAERTRLLGYLTFVHYRLDDTMARTPEAVRGLLDRAWLPRRLRELVHAAGNLRDSVEVYLAFRGRLPSIDVLLHQRGLCPSAKEAYGPLLCRCLGRVHPYGTSVGYAISRIV